MDNPAVDSLLHDLRRWLVSSFHGAENLMARLRQDFEWARDEFLAGRGRTYPHTLTPFFAQQLLIWADGFVRDRVCRELGEDVAVALPPLYIEENIAVITEALQPPPNPWQIDTPMRNAYQLAPVLLPTVQAALAAVTEEALTMKMGR